MVIVVVEHWEVNCDGDCVVGGQREKPRKNVSVGICFSIDRVTQF